MSVAGLWWNPQKTGATGVARQLVDALEARGVSVLADAALAQALGRPDLRFGPDGYAACRVIITLGGDGTFLSGMHVAVGLGVPMLGVNLGRVGFLTEIEPSDIERDVEALVSGDYAVERRMLLRVRAPGMDEAFALNDAALMRASGRVIRLTALVDGAPAERFSGDGLIVATPTGSTAYSFSAGGPVVAPTAQVMLLTPVCAHALSARPLVIPDACTVEMRAADCAPAHLVIDGVERALITDGAPITVDKSEKYVELIRLKSRNFFSLLRAKLTEWSE